jgi:hypothetical protein
VDHQDRRVHLDLPDLAEARVHQKLYLTTIGEHLQFPPAVIFTLIMVQSEVR